MKPPYARPSSWIVAAVLSAGLAATGPARAVIQGTTWFPIGPAPSCCFFPGGESGRATAVAVNPANFSEVWIGTAGGGLWRSTDAATNWTWTPMTDNQASLAIGSVTLADCSDSGCLHVYAGTGENAIRRDTYYGRGLLVGTRVSMFGDMQWELRTGTPYSFSRGSIYNVVLDPNTLGESRHIYVTLSSGVTASASESTVTAPEVVISGGGGGSIGKSVVDYGLYKSLNDGMTWAKLVVPGTTGYRPTDLEMDATNPSVLYAGFLERGIFKSTSGGAKWCPLNPGFPVPSECPATTGLPDHASTPFDHVEIALDPADADHLYATFGMCPDRLLQDCTPSVYESFNGGEDWTRNFAGSTSPSSDATCPSAYSRYTHALTVYPADPGTLYLGGIRLCKSTDHGATWAPADSNVHGRTIHFDHRAVVFDSVGFRGYDVNDGGIATWEYPGTAWTPRNAGIQTIGFQSIATSPLTPRVIGGAQDNSGLMWIGSKQWTSMPCCGDGGFAVMDDDDAMKLYITSNINGLSNLTVIPRRSTTGGSFFSHADSGIPESDPRSFYPPLVQDPDPTALQNPLYFGTNRLWLSTDDASSWTAVSPVLSTTPSSEIFSGVDVITAIAIAPNDPSRIYLGYYSGKVFATDGACDLPSCWFEFDFGLPAAPVTSLAVNPLNKENVYATFSGFFSGAHVYSKTQFTVSWFPTGSISELSGVPANWISIEPGAPNRLWLGTDKGLYKSLNAGGSWFKFGTGLPNAPVYQIGIDEGRQRVVAATHGRGAFLLTGPSLQGYGGCMDNFVWNLAVYGHGFNPNHGCTMKLLRQDNSVCASGPVDASGGTIATDKDGVLATWKTGEWAADPGVWACLHGKCLNNTDVGKCNQPNNPLSTVVAICANQVAFAQVPGCPTLANPPSSWLSLTGQSGDFLAPGPDASFDRGPGSAAPDAGQPVPSLAASIDPAMNGGGSFMLIPTVQSGDGTSRKLCAVGVTYMPGDTPTMILEHARDAVNMDPGCLSEGVSAAVRQAALESEVEDLFPHAGNLVLMASGLTGSQLIPAIEVQPGPIGGPCFDVGQLGVPVDSQLRMMRLGFMTLPAGAGGGSLSIKETSSLGECAITVPTAAGDSADGIASAIEAAFADPGPIGCPSTANPHDLRRQAGGLNLVLASGIQVCLGDAGVGMTIGPQEICFSDADCNDGNPCTNDTCDTGTGQCQNAPEPDGLPCDDLNACTSGNFCQNGTCGQVVSCEDFDPCTDDACDPPTGVCLSTPVECDDANPCTSDFCNPEVGGCSFFPIVGTTCDDGNACTVGDICEFAPGAGSPSCRGFDACDDGDPCTADNCDPITGACQNQPIQCDDGNPCTTDFCDPGTGECLSTPTPDVPCDDGDACTMDDHCAQSAIGISCEGAPVTCDDLNLCTTDSCDPSTGQCLNKPIDCDDGQGCTDDVCLPTTGQCAHPPRNCDDSDACTTDSCVAPACVVPDNGTGTADLPTQCPYTGQTRFGFLEASGDALFMEAVHRTFTCPSGSLVCSFPLPVPGTDCSQPGGTLSGEEACADSILALSLTGIFNAITYTRTIDLPVSFEMHAAPRTPGDPVQPFTTDMFRLFGTILPSDNDPDFELLRFTAGSDFGLPSSGHTTLTQSGGDWTVDSFFDVTLRVDIVGRQGGPLANVNRSDTYTVRFRTGAGQCVHTPVDCDDGDPCTVDSCDPQTGACLHSPVSCDDGDACTTDSCDPQTGACVHTPLTCDDGNACTVNDRCVPTLSGGTTCQGDPKDCYDGDPCTEDTCVSATTGECAHTPTNCDDGDACTSDSCAPLGCIVPDNGGGTADLPPVACPYLGEDKLGILDGIFPAGSILIDAVLGGFSCPAVPGADWVCTFPSPNPGVDCSQGTPAAGEQSCADAVLSMHMVGTGILAGFVRDIPLGVSLEERLKPRVPGTPLQSFDTDMFRMFGKLLGDPDFDLLRITCGTDFGYPSPGHTTLTQMGGNWGVDGIFFNLTCRIDFVGALGSPLQGRSGSTAGSYRFRTRGGQCVHTPVSCDDGDACTFDSCDPASGGCVHSPVNCDDNNACTLDSCDPIAGCLHQAPPVVEPGPSMFQSQTEVSWPVSPGATHWNTYRGTIPSGMLGSRLPGSVYDQACFESADAFGDGPTLTTDTSIPLVGTAFYYLMSGEDDCAESDIGHSSSGATIPNALACPTPP